MVFILIFSYESVYNYMKGYLVKAFTDESQKFLNALRWHIAAITALLTVLIERL